MGLLASSLSASTLLILPEVLGPLESVAERSILFNTQFGETVVITSEIASAPSSPFSFQSSGHVRVTPYCFLSFTFSSVFPSSLRLRSFVLDIFP